MIALFAAINWLSAQNQTETFSPVTNWNGNYTISVQSYDMGSTSVPTLQAFASGIYDNEWVVLAGRTNGMHGFSPSGTTNFPPAAQNSEVWVIDPVTKQTWSKSLSDPTSGLSASVVNSLSSTATQSHQDGSTLFVSGGYVYDSAINNFTTYNTLSAVSLPDVVNWVKGATPTLGTNSILQTTGSTSSNGSFTGGFFAVTGGELLKNGSDYHLTFGQDFEGPYTPGSNGTYTSQVRNFTVNYDKAAGTLSYTEQNVSPAPGDDSKYRRRDLNVVPSISKDPTTGQPKEGMIAYSGVFYNGSGVWTVPVEIDAAGNPVMTNPNTDPNAFKQAMNNYNSAKLGLYSQKSGDFTEFLLGGITANTYDPENGTLTYDDQLPFTSQITAVTRDEDGNYQQYYAGEYPNIVDGEGDRILFGAEAHFFRADGLPLYDNDVINQDALADGTLLGYIYGGIAADAPNNGTSAASNEIFAVYYNAVPEPSTMMLAALGAVAIGALWRKRRLA